MDRQSTDVHSHKFKFFSKKWKSGMRVRCKKNASKVKFIRFVVLAVALTS